MAFMWSYWVLAVGQSAGSEAAASWWRGVAPWMQTAPTWLFSAAVALGAVVVAVLFRRGVLSKLERLAASTENDLDDRLVALLRSFAFVVIYAVALLLILDNHGVSVSPLLAGAGIAGIALGFAAKETLADILSGFFLIVDRPMGLGDRVKIERIGRDWGGWGDVVEVGLRRTKIKNTDGVMVNYPNNVLANSVITNFSAEQHPVRVRVRFQVGYDADLAHTQEVAKGAIERSEGVLPGTVDLVVRSLWDDTRGHLLAGVLVEGRYRIKDVRDRTRIRSRVLANLLEDLRQAGIPLPAAAVQMVASQQKTGAS